MFILAYYVGGPVVSAPGHRADAPSLRAEKFEIREEALDRARSLINKPGVHGLALHGKLSEVILNPQQLASELGVRLDPRAF